MRFTFAAFILLSAPGLGYIPTFNLKLPFRPRTSSTLGYAKDFLTTQTPSITPREDSSIANLRKSLEYSEDKIREAYTQWLEQYDKVDDEYRYSVFKKNFLMQEAYNRKAGTSFSLNEHADISEKEAKINTLRNVLGYSEHIIRDKYSNWLLEYSKEANEYRYVIFKQNFLTQEKYNREFGKSFSLNEYGDLTSKEADVLKLQKVLGYSEAAMKDRYNNWLIRYNKEADERRYTTFKHNFLMQEEYNRRVGASFSLNQYADLTEKEYNVMKAKQKVMKPQPPSGKMNTTSISNSTDLSSDDKGNDDVVELVGESSATQESNATVNANETSFSAIFDDTVESRAPKDQQTNTLKVSDELDLGQPVVDLDDRLVNKMKNDGDIKVQELFDKLEERTTFEANETSSFRVDDENDNSDTNVSRTTQDSMETIYEPLDSSIVTSCDTDNGNGGVQMSENSASESSGQLEKDAISTVVRERSVDMNIVAGTFEETIDVAIDDVQQLGAESATLQETAAKEPDMLAAAPASNEVEKAFEMQRASSTKSVMEPPTTDQAMKSDIYAGEMVASKHAEELITKGVNSRLIFVTDEDHPHGSTVDAHGPSSCVQEEPVLDRSTLTFSDTDDDRWACFETFLAADIVDAIKQGEIKESIMQLGARMDERDLRVNPSSHNSDALAGESVCSPDTEDYEIDSLLEAFFTPETVERIQTANNDWVSNESMEINTENEEEIHNQVLTDMEEEEKEEFEDFHLQSDIFEGEELEEEFESYVHFDDELDMVDSTEGEEEDLVEIIDETDIFVEKYKAIDDAEERAFEIIKDLKFVKPAPQHFSFSYIDETPELNLAGSTYIDSLHNPELSAVDGPGAFNNYVSSIPASESGTFEEGKVGSKLGASTNYLEDICDMLEPFMDCTKVQQRTPISITSPVEDFVYQKAAQIKNLSDKAFRVLVELCSIGRCER